MICWGYCPIITRHNYLHWAHCNTTGCPNDTFKSDEVYKCKSHLIVIKYRYQKKWYQVQLNNKMVFGDPSGI